MFPVQVDCRGLSVISHKTNTGKDILNQRAKKSENTPEAILIYVFFLFGFFKKKRALYQDKINLIIYYWIKLYQKN
jgi:hypothetical protein